MKNNIRSRKSLTRKRNYCRSLRQRESRRKQKAYTLKEKSKIRAELRQIDRLFKERKKLELEALARERKARSAEKAH